MTDSAEIPANPTTDPTNLEIAEALDELGDLYELDGDEPLINAARTREAYIAAETLAVRVGYESLDGAAKPVLIDGLELRVVVALA